MQKIPKKWRELPKEERFEIPEKIFGIDKREIERIRKIDDIKKRLIESAKLQFELFGDIHSQLTVWIAGYGSDQGIRSYFGSTKNLLDIFMKFVPKNSQVEYSWGDVKRNITIPLKMSMELAEETGIHIGDGNLYSYKEGEKFLTYRYSISGDLANEFLYHTVYIAKLIKKIYNLDVSFVKRPLKNNIDTRCSSKAVIEFKNKVLGLPIGSKKNIEIPSVILENHEFSKRCLCGIFDTDFNITSSLAISGKIHGIKVVKQIHEILVKNNIKHIFKLYPEYGRFYIPQKEAKVIVYGWGMNNLKHLTKFQVFDKFGIFIPFTTTSERIDLLNNKISLKELQNISVSRRKMPLRLQLDSN